MSLALFFSCIFVDLALGNVCVVVKLDWFCDFADPQRAFLFMSPRQINFSARTLD